MPIEPLAWKAGALGAAALMLLVPTFNALNSSHFDVREPPFRITPPTIPPDFRPPTPDEEMEQEEVDIVAEMLGHCPEREVRTRLEHRESFPAPNPLSPLQSRVGSHDFEMSPIDVAIGLRVNFTTSYHGDITLQASGGGKRDSWSAASTFGPTQSPNSAWMGGTDDVAAGAWTLRWDVSTVTGAFDLDLNVAYLACKAPAANSTAEAEP